MLSGSLDAFGLEDVLRLIAAAEKTGRLDIVRARVAGMLLVDRGEVVGASRSETPALEVDVALDAAADLFGGSGGAFVFTRLSDPPMRVIDLDLEGFLSETQRRVQARAAADLLRELAETDAAPPTAVKKITLDRPTLRPLTREEQRMRLRV